MPEAHYFFSGRIPPEVQHAVDRMLKWPGVVQLALLPDAHLGGESCVGVALATDSHLYPPAVGTDIGCGMASVRLTGTEPPHLSESLGRELLGRLQRVVPASRHHERQPLPHDPGELSTDRLAGIARRQGAVQFATLGQGNHFLELQRDDAGDLWLTVHTGSRGVGAAVHAHHTAAGPSLPTNTPEGQAYLADVAWCRRYAAHSRRAILGAAGAATDDLLGLIPDWSTLLDCDHNHLQPEHHGGRVLYIHRKGVTPAALDQPGIIAGSMGTRTVHTRGLGNPASLASSSHGAGRLLTRKEARQRISRSELRRLMQGIIYDTHLEPLLVEESPTAYRDLRHILAAQAHLTRSIRTLHPILVHKSG